MKFNKSLFYNLQFTSAFRKVLDISQVCFNFGIILNFQPKFFTTLIKAFLVKTNYSTRPEIHI